MVPQPVDMVEKVHQVTESVKKNLHFLTESNPDVVDISSLVGFNKRIVLSDCKPFLEAIKKEIGGEILEDSKIGPFLYYGD